MTGSLMSLSFMWLLSVTACNAATPRQDLYSTSEATTHEASRFNPHTPSIRDDVSPTKETASTKLPLQTTQTILTKTFLNTEKTATTSSILPPSLSSTGMMVTTEEQATVIKSTRAVTSIPTKPTMILAELSNSSQGQENTNSSPFQFTTSEITHPSTRPPQSTEPTSDVSTFTTSEEVKSGDVSTVTRGDVSQSTASHKTSLATRPTGTTKKKKRNDVSKKGNKSNDGEHHGNAVAGIIGGALLLMMVGFLVIYIKKRKLQKQTITTTDWAGPSPFLDGGADNGHGAQRSSNRISLTTFLPQGLVKRMSLLPEDELEDVVTGTTFRDKHHKNSLDGADVEESKGAAGVPGKESVRDPAEADGSVGSTTFFQTNKPVSSNGNVSPDHSAVPFNTCADGQPEMNNDLSANLIPKPPKE